MLELVDQLLSEPSSRYRARVLKDTPNLGKGSGEFSFLGWSQTETLLVALHNSLLMALTGKKAKRALLEPPSPVTVRLIAKTIAEFDEGAFFQTIHARR